MSEAEQLKIIVQCLQDSMRSVSDMIQKTVPKLRPNPSAQSLADTLSNAIVGNPFMRPLEAMMINDSSDEVTK